jgi:hypothetical protein
MTLENNNSKPASWWMDNNIDVTVDNQGQMEKVSNGQRPSVKQLLQLSTTVSVEDHLMSVDEARMSSQAVVSLEDAIYSTDQPITAVNGCMHSTVSLVTSEVDVENVTRLDDPYFTEVHEDVLEWSKRMVTVCQDNSVVTLQPDFLVPFAILSQLVSHHAVCEQTVGKSSGFVSLLCYF